MKRPTKFVFVTGGVLSSLGKGLSSAAIGARLESRGLKVSFLKLDPYLNVDPGTMNPFQHGEVYAMKVFPSGSSRKKVVVPSLIRRIEVPLFDLRLSASR